MVASVFVEQARKREQREKKQIQISQTIQRWLLVAIVFAFAVTTLLVFSLQDRLSTVQGEKLLSMALDETEADIRDAAFDEPQQDVTNLTQNRHVGKTGYILILDEQFNVISAPESQKNISVQTYQEKIDSHEENSAFEMEWSDEDCFVCYRLAEGYLIVSILPTEEAMYERNVALYLNAFMVMIVFAVLFTMIYLLIKRAVVNPIKCVNSSLGKITDGNLSEVVNVRTNEEFTALSDGINMTVDTLKNYIDEASRRLDKELELAKDIQRSALPSVFPAFPKRKDLDIFASMDPAKEVGGDFYDFYITQQDVLNILVADVAGKGIPAVMSFVEKELEDTDCSAKIVGQINVAVDEIFSNIVHYGYTDQSGPITVDLMKQENPKLITLRFLDEAVPYNPLTAPEPDITLPIEEREIGGLGIFSG